MVEEVCVVTGPITKPRNKNNERTYRVESHLIHPVVGCPMIFCRLVSASHLNGELGEVKVATYDDGVIFSVEVHFEKKGAKSTLVKPENLRIVFDLPKR